MNTIEVIFACKNCGRKRQYGSALSIHDRPDNLSPKISCLDCTNVTEHQFIKNEIRTNDREIYQERLFI